MSKASTGKRSPRWDKRLSDQPAGLLVRRFFITLGIVLIILYVGILFLSRLPGFAYIAGEKFGDYTGLSSTPARSWCDTGLNIFLEDLKSNPDLVKQRGALDIKRVEMYWDRHGVELVVVEEPRAELHYRPGFGWVPSRLGKVASLPLFDDLEGEPAPPPKKVVEDDPPGVDIVPSPRAEPRPPAASLAPINFLAPKRGLPRSRILIQNGHLELLDRNAVSRATITALNLEFTPAHRSKDGRLHLKFSALYSIPSKGRREEVIRIELYHGPDGFVVEEAVAEQRFIMGLQDALQDALRNMLPLDEAGHPEESSTGAEPEVPPSE